jgi:hypothetical protein
MHLPGLADIPVLAKFAGQIATGGTKGENRGTGQKVIEGFFLDRIDAESARATIGIQYQGTLVVFPDITKSLLPLFDAAISGAEIALNLLIIDAVPVFGWKMGLHGDL